MAAGFNAPISGVFFAVETVLQRQLLAGKEEDDRPRGSRQTPPEPQRLQTLTETLTHSNNPENTLNVKRKRQ